MPEPVTIGNQSSSNGLPPLLQPTTPASASSCVYDQSSPLRHLQPTTPASASSSVSDQSSSGPPPTGLEPRTPFDYIISDTPTTALEPDISDASSDPDPQPSATSAPEAAPLVNSQLSSGPMGVQTPAF